MFSSRSVRSVLLLLFVALLVVPSTSQAILVNPGVVFMTDVGIQYRAQNPLHFGSIRLGTNHLKLDSTDLRFEYNGTFYANLTALNFLDSSQTALVVVEWLGTSTSATMSWFNTSGLAAGAVYTFTVDTIVKANFIADSGGSIFIPWNNTDTNQHEFAIFTPYASISAQDWTMILLLILFLAMLVAGFFISFVHIIDGIIGFFFGAEVYSVTGSIGLAIVIFALSIFILLLGIFRRTQEFGV